MVNVYVNWDIQILPVVWDVLQRGTIIYQKESVNVHRNILANTAYRAPYVNLMAVAMQVAMEMEVAYVTLDGLSPIIASVVCPTISVTTVNHARGVGMDAVMTA